MPIVLHFEHISAGLTSTATACIAIAVGTSTICTTIVVAVVNAVAVRVASSSSRHIVKFVLVASSHSKRAAATC